MSIAWHPKRWWNVSCQKMRKKKQKQFVLSNAFNTSEKYNLKVPRHFVIQRLDIVIKVL